MMRFLAVVVALVLAAPGAHAQGWELSSEVDDFSNETRVVAMSPEVSGDPYESSRIFVRCTNGQELETYIVFNYLNPTQREGTYIRLQTKIDAEDPFDTKARLSREGRSLFLVGGLYLIWEDLTEKSLEVFTDPEQRRESVKKLQDSKRPSAHSVAKRLETASAYAIRLSYHNVGPVTIRYDMNGSSETIQEVISACGPWKDEDGGNTD